LTGRPKRFQRRTHRQTRCGCRSERRGRTPPARCYSSGGVAERHARRVAQRGETDEGAHPATPERHSRLTGFSVRGGPKWRPTVIFHSAIVSRDRLQLTDHVGIRIRLCNKGNSVSAGTDQERPVANPSAVHLISSWQSFTPSSSRRFVHGDTIFPMVTPKAPHVRRSACDRTPRPAGSAGPRQRLQMLPDTSVRAGQQLPGGVTHRVGGRKNQLESMASPRTGRGFMISDRVH